MKRIFYHEKYVKIKKTFYELLERIEEISKKSKNVKNQSSNTFDKVTCFDKTSMMNFNDERIRFSWFNSFMFCNSTFIMMCCSFSTNFNYCIKRCCLTTFACCFTIVAWSFAFNFLRYFSSRRYRSISKRIKSQTQFKRIHSKHLFDSFAILHAFIKCVQWEQKRIAKTSILKDFNKLYLRWNDVFFCLGIFHDEEKKNDFSRRETWREI